MPDQEVTIEVMMVLIQQERQMWLNTREVWTMRIRVAQRLAGMGLGQPDEVKIAQRELERCEAALDENDKILRELQQPERLLTAQKLLDESDKMLAKSQ